MSEDLSLDCPTCQRAMSPLTSYEGIWSCPKCRKVWIEQFESDFKLTKPKKIKHSCPGCESQLFKAQDEKGKESFIFCSDCGGIQLSHKQTFLFNDEMLSEEIKKSFQKKRSQKQKPKEVKVQKAASSKESALKKIIFGYGYTVAFLTTLLAVLPQGIWFRFLGTDSLLQFTQIPYLDSFPLMITIILILVPAVLISLKEIAAAKAGLFVYFILMHLYLAWGLMPVANLFADYTYYKSAQIEDKNNDGIEDALVTLLESRGQRGTLNPALIPVIKGMLKSYYDLVEEFYQAPHPFAYINDNNFSNSALNKSLQNYVNIFCKNKKVSRGEKINLLRTLNTSARNKYIKTNSFLFPIETGKIFISCN
jgi:Zn-finger nucleic acid-binding protein